MTRLKKVYGVPGRRKEGLRTYEAIFVYRTEQGDYTKAGFRYRAADFETAKRLAARVVQNELHSYSTIAKALAGEL